MGSQVFSESWSLQALLGTGVYNLKLILSQVCKIYSYNVNIIIKLFLYQIKFILQVSYAIGVAEPLSITVFDYGTSKLSQNQLLDIVNKNFDLRPGMIVKYVLFLNQML